MPSTLSAPPTGIQDFVACRNIAVVGASKTGKKFGNVIVRDLRKAGYEVAAVHPDGGQIEGQIAWPSLAALPRPPDGIVICVAPAKVEGILRQAASLGIRRVWLQQGAESPEAVALARELGLSMAYRACVLMYLRPVRSYHALHRGLMKLVGRLERTPPGP